VGEIMKIKEVAEKYDVSADTLRYWERIGAIPPANRDSAGYRDYDKEDQDWIYFTKCMRDVGVSIERIIEYINLFKQGDHTIPYRKELLSDQRDELGKKLAILQKTYDTLDKKINNYEETMLSYEGKLRLREDEEQ